MKGKKKIISHIYLKVLLASIFVSMDFRLWILLLQWIIEHNTFLHAFFYKCFRKNCFIQFFHIETRYLILNYTKNPLVDDMLLG